VHAGVRQDDDRDHGVLTFARTGRSANWSNGRNSRHVGEGRRTAAEGRTRRDCHSYTIEGSSHLAGVLTLGEATTSHPSGRAT
jgi:hypothetical protein